MLLETPQNAIKIIWFIKQYLTLNNYHSILIDDLQVN